MVDDDLSSNNQTTDEQSDSSKVDDGTNDQQIDDKNQTNQTKTEFIAEYHYDICIQNQTFMAVDMIQPPNSFPENGILGLAPSKNKMSIVRTLKQ